MNTPFDFVIFRLNASIAVDFRIFPFFHLFLILQFASILLI